MNKIILQPAGNPDAYEHYIESCSNPVSLNRITSFVSENDARILRTIYSTGVFLWGVTAGKTLSNKRNWDKIESGDVGLFSRNGVIFSSGVVTYKMHNKDLALELWGTDNDGETWEYIYFLDEIKNHNIPYPYFNEVVGYKKKYIIRGFNVLDESKSNAVFEKFNLRSGIHLPPIEKDEHKEILHNLTGDNNEKVETYRRKEQEYLKSSLFGYKKQIECGICNKTFNKDMVWCSHIKKRRYCTNEEQVNLNVVMPMCKFGCDDLFEKGYLTVSEGSVKILKRSGNSDDLDDYLNEIEGNTCSYWGDKTIAFFKWHNDFHTN